MRGRPVFPAEQQPVILVVGSVLLALGVELPDEPGQSGEGEGVEGDHALRVLGLAVRLDDATVDHHAGGPNGKCSGCEVEPVQACPGQLALPHARGRLQDPEGIEAVGPGVVEEGPRLCHGPDRAPLTGTVGGVLILDDVAMYPLPGFKVCPGAVQDAVDVDDGLRSQPLTLTLWFPAVPETGGAHLGPRKS